MPRLPLFRLLGILREQHLDLVSRELFLFALGAHFNLVGGDSVSDQKVLDESGPAFAERLIVRPGAAHIGMRVDQESALVIVRFVILEVRGDFRSCFFSLATRPVFGCLLVG